MSSSALIFRQLFRHGCPKPFPEMPSGLVFCRLTPCGSRHRIALAVSPIRPLSHLSVPCQRHFFHLPTSQIFVIPYSCPNPTNMVGCETDHKVGDRNRI
jgi:hypothetical protein